MSIGKDKTLVDNGRTLLNLTRSEIGNVLPEYVSEEFPNLITLFEQYYKWMDSDVNPNGSLRRLYSSRDATQVPDGLLQYIEDELLLGQAYFGGFLNKREAIKYSNLLYRSKGTKYSIEQFFRAFFGVDPQVIYPKENVFLVGPVIDREQAPKNTNGEQIKTEGSRLGPESRRFITDDKLYQTLAILIRVGISVRDWIDVYKLFVHPAGMYLGSELLIEIFNEVGFRTIQEDEGDLIPESLRIAAQAIAEVRGSVNQTFLQVGDSDQPIFRTITNQFYGDYNTDSDTIAQYSENFTYQTLLSPTSVTMDDSAANTTVAGTYRVTDMSSSKYMNVANDIHTKLLQIAVGTIDSDYLYDFLTEIPEGETAQRGDFDRNGSITASDALIFLQYINGDSDSLTTTVDKWMKKYIDPYIRPRLGISTFDQHKFSTQYDSDGS